MKSVYEEITGTPSNSELVDISGEDFYGPGYEDHTRVPADIAKLRSLGWAPEHSLRDTLVDIMTWYYTNKESLLPVSPVG